MRVKRPAFCVLALAAAVGCGQGLPDPTKVEGLRVLAIKAEPPEVRGTAPSVTRLTPLVVRPGAEPVDSMRWYRCDDWDLNANTFMCPFNGGSETQLGTGSELSYTVDPARLFSMAADKAAALSGARKEDMEMILQFIGVWDTVNLGVRASEERVESFKRIVVSGPMAGSAASMFSKMPGSEACAELGDNIPPNTNPDLLEVRYMDMVTGEAGLLDKEGTVALAPGRKVQLMPVVDWDSFEDYPKLDILGESFKCEPAEEFPIISWFCEAGDLSDRNTASRSRADPAQLARLATMWNTPSKEDVPEDGEVRCWVILRDGRGGVDWETFVVSIEE